MFTQCAWIVRYWQETRRKTIGRAQEERTASAGKAIEILMVRASRQSPSRRFQWLWGWSSSTETEKPLRTTSVAGVNEHLFKPGLHDYPWSFGEGRPYCRLTKVIPLIFLNILLGEIQPKISIQTLLFHFIYRYENYVGICGLSFKMNLKLVINVSSKWLF